MITKATLMNFFIKLRLTACQRPIALAALKVALVVGAMLNLINQGDRLLDRLTLSWFDLSLNYLVPYCVFSYGAARNKMCRSEARPI